MGSLLTERVDGRREMAFTKIGATMLVACTHLFFLADCCGDSPAHGNSPLKLSPLVTKCAYLSTHLEHNS